MRRRERAVVALVALVGAVVLAVAVALALPVVSGNSHRAEGAPADEQVTEVPVNALGGLALSGVLGAGLWFGVRRRPPGDR